MALPQSGASTRPDAGVLRWARAASVALACTVLATGAHVMAGGGTSPNGAVLVFLGTWVVAGALAGRRLTTSQLVGLLMLGQVVVHVVNASASSMGAHDLMIAAHVAGTALCAVLLRRGEDTLWTLADRIGLRARAITAIEPIVPWHPAAVPNVLVRSLRPVLLTHVIEGRGPPVGLI